MQERGVSKRVSVKLEQIGADGTIAADAHDELDEQNEIAPTTSNGKANRSALNGKAEEVRESIIEAKPIISETVEKD